MIKTKKQMFTLIGSFLLFIVLGTVSYAFFGRITQFSVNKGNDVGLMINDNMGDKEIIPTISSCPGCVFMYQTEVMYTSWNTEGEVPTVLDINDYSENYEEVIKKTNNKFFLGLVINKTNSTINSAYVCGIYKDDITNHEIPFCIEGTADGKKYSDNTHLLQEIWNNTCTGNLYCETKDIEVDNSMDGYVDIGNEINDCSVNTDGMVVCGNN